MNTYIVKTSNGKRAIDALSPIEAGAVASKDEGLRKGARVVVINHNGVRTKYKVINPPRGLKTMGRER